MKPGFAVVTGVAALVLAAVGAGALYRSLDVTHSHFGGYAEAETAGMFDAGWLPRYLPRSAFEINETHDIDTNRVRATFRYRVGDVPSVPGACTPIERSSLGTSFRCVDAPAGRLVLGSDGQGSYTGYGDDGRQLTR